jgi:hypothetical protein
LATKKDNIATFFALLLQHCNIPDGIATLQPPKNHIHSFILHWYNKLLLNKSSRHYLLLSAAQHLSSSPAPQHLSTSPLASALLFFSNLLLVKND